MAVADDWLFWFTVYIWACLDFELRHDVIQFFVQ